MNTFQKNTLFLALLLCGLGGLAGAGYSVYRSNEVKTAELHKAWNKENIRSLKSLSTIGVLSTEEQDRLDRAGDDVDRIQQVLLELHTERHTMWAARKSDVDDRAQKLQRLSFLASYDQDGTFREVRTQLNKERTEVADNLSAYEQGYAEIKSWRPVSFEAYESDPRSASKAAASNYSTRKPNAQILAAEPAVQQQVPIITETSERTTANISEEDLPSPTQNALDGVDRDISQLLKTWSSAMESNNPQVIAACYANHMDRYFLKLDLNNDQVQQYMTDWLDHGTKQIAQFRLSDVTIENETASTAKLRLVKNVTINGSSGASNLVTRSRLYLKKDNGDWKITSEQDFKN